MCLSQVRYDRQSTYADKRSPGSCSIGTDMTRPHSNVSSPELLHRIRAEYREMPGLQLTASQAQRLFGVDANTWDAALAALVSAKFLSLTRNGQFGMVGI